MCPCQCAQGSFSFFFLSPFIEHLFAFITEKFQGTQKQEEYYSEPSCTHYPDSTTQLFFLPILFHPSSPFFPFGRKNFKANTKDDSIYS